MSIGFIILRHVNSIKTNLYWQKCYDCIRLFYADNKIIIIDDNSDDNLTEKDMINTEIINSEFPSRGELLPYYYYSKNKWFDTAVIIHDSVFINKYIDFQVDNYKLIWEFEHNWDQPIDEIILINLLSNNNELLNFHKNKDLWKGCFGCMTVITYDYLQIINNKYTISNLLNNITTRYNRCSFERVLACMLQLNYKKVTLFGNIHKYCRWGLSFDNYIKYNINLPLIKVWTGR